MVADKLLAQYPLKRSGELSRLLHDLVSAETLAQLADQLGLGPCIKLSLGTALKLNAKADVFEAVTGAIDRDGGLAAAQAIIGPLFDPLIATVGGQTAHVRPEDKGALITYSLHRGLPGPVYDTVPIPGPAFRCTLSIAGLTVVYTRPAKKDAEKACARQMVDDRKAAGLW